MRTITYTSNKSSFYGKIFSYYYLLPDSEGMAESRLQKLRTNKGPPIDANGNRPGTFNSQAYE